MCDGEKETEIKRERDAANDLHLHLLWPLAFKSGIHMQMAAHTQP